jgi:AcrR family transcriptional regulator
MEIGDRAQRGRRAEGGATAEAEAPNRREAILAAAEAIVVERGANALTIDEVARIAGLSKGGVFYHFATKEALTVAMIERFVDRFDAAMDGLAAEDGEPRGRKLRAYVRATAGEASVTGPAFDRACGSITAALANFPEKLAPVRDQGARHQREIEADGLDPVFASIVRLAIDGLWLSENFNLADHDPAMRAAVVDRLVGWTRLADLPAADRRGAPPPAGRAPNLRLL